MSGVWRWTGIAMIGGSVAQIGLTLKRATRSAVIPHGLEFHSRCDDRTY